MLLADCNPFVRLAMTAYLGTWVHEDTFHRLKTPDCKLFYIMDGSGNMIIENRTHRLLPGCVILLPAGTEYVWQPDAESGIHYITINFDYTQNFSNIRKSFHPFPADHFREEDILEHVVFDDAAVLNAPLLLTQGASLQNRLLMLTTEFFLGGKYCCELLSSLLKSVLIGIARMVSMAGSKEEKKELFLTREVIQYIQEHYNENLTNETLAEAFHFNSCYLNRIFKKHVGIPMHTFLLNYRLTMAKEMLASGSTPIREVLLMTGFRDAPHFTKYFKKQTGLTPGEFRKEAARHV